MAPELLPTLPWECISVLPPRLMIVSTSTSRGKNNAAHRFPVKFQRVRVISAPLRFGFRSWRGTGSLPVPLLAPGIPESLVTAPSSSSHCQDGRMDSIPSLCCLLMGQGRVAPVAGRALWPPQLLQLSSSCESGLKPCPEWRLISL